jgi:hypothetical protein
MKNTDELEAAYLAVIEQLGASRLSWHHTHAKAHRDHLWIQPPETLIAAEHGYAIHQRAARQCSVNYPSDWHSAHQQAVEHDASVSAASEQIYGPLAARGQ